MHGVPTAGMIKIVLQGSKFVQADYNGRGAKVLSLFLLAVHTIIKLFFIITLHNV